MRMEPIKIDEKNVKMIAHRGLSGVEVENTRDAFILATKYSYYGIETDVHVTLDGKYIICHDDSTLRVSGIDMIIEESHYEELRKIKIINKDNTFSKEMYLPNLEEYINICKSGNKFAVLELKNEMKEANIIEIVNIIKEMNYYDKTIFISFSKENIVNLRKLFNDSSCQFLSVVDTKEKMEDALNFAVQYKCNLDLHYKGITKEFVNECHQNNILLNVWTIDDEAVAKELIDMGVDFITSNILE